MATVALLFALFFGPPVAADALRLEGHGGPIKGVAVAKNGRQALTASFDYALGLWDLDSGARVAWLDGHGAAVNDALFLEDGRALSGGDDFAVILWDLAAGAALARETVHRGKVVAVALSPDGAHAASASWDGTVALWRVERAGLALLARLEGHQGAVNDVVFSADGQDLLSASADGTVRRWRVSDRALVRTEISHGFGVNRLVLSEDGAWLAYGAVDGVVRVLDLSDGREIASMTGDRRPILALDVSPNGRRVAFGDGEGYVSVASTESWTLTRDFRAAARGPIWALAFVDDARLIGAGLDDFAALWPIAADAGPVFADDAPRRFHLDPETVSNGERQFARKCSVCHTLTPDGGRRAGPTLHELFGRRVGGLAGYAYSDALRSMDFVWTPETLDKLFDLGPDHFTPGSKMPMQRITRDEDRADLIAYLQAATTPALETSETPK